MNENAIQTEQAVPHECTLTHSQLSAPPARSRMPSASKALLSTVREWSRVAVGVTLGILLFETVSGLFIYFSSFSVFNQYNVLAHTGIGLVTIPPVIWYLVTHWLHRGRSKFNHFQLLGYLSAAAWIVLTVSGVVLTWQAGLGQKIGQTWDLVHVVSTFVFIAVLGAHLVTLLIRRVNQVDLSRALRRAQMSCLNKSVAFAAVPLAVCLMGAVLHHTSIETDDAFPDDYSFKYGPDRPFAPSLSRKDMSETEKRLKTRILSALDEGQRPVFLAGFRSDPNRHVGIVSVAEELCASFDLTPSQRPSVDRALSDARREFAEHGAISAKKLAGSESCGRCHAQIVEEWLPSAHRYSSMDFVFQEVQKNFAEDKAPEAVRYCAGCHDPIALFAGAKNVGNETLSVEGAHEGISCNVCHAMVQTDVRGNADYTIAVQESYLFETSDGPVAQWLGDFLIRAYPQHHVASYSRPLYKTAEACGACHKQFIDEEVNDFGWVQGQNQYDSWRKSKWHREGDPAATLGCRECHMPLVDSTDPASGDQDDLNRSPDDGKHRSHKFLAANQFVPRYHELPGAEEHCEETVRWLRGEYEIPEIADRWSSGPVIRVALQVPDEVRSGDEVTLRAIVTNNKAGHDFPTGPLDMIEGWVEITVEDSGGNTVFTSSRADERGYLFNPKIVFKAELIDQLGSLIGRHDLWRLVGARYKRSLYPGVSDATTFTFQCPGTAPAGKEAVLKEEHDHAFTVPSGLSDDTLTVTAVVWYCKFSAPFLDRLFGEEAGLRSEVTDIARAEATIRIRHGS